MPLFHHCIHQANMMEVALNVYHPEGRHCRKEPVFHFGNAVTALARTSGVYTSWSSASRPHFRADESECEKKQALKAKRIKNGKHVKTAIRVKSILSRVCCSVLGLPLESRFLNVSPKIQYMSAVMPPPPAKLAADPCHDEMRLVFFQRKIRGGRKGGV